MKRRNKKLTSDGAIKWVEIAELKFASSSVYMSLVYICREILNDPIIEISRLGLLPPT
jgi:hypothetical protein